MNNGMGGASRAIIGTTFAAFVCVAGCAKNTRATTMGPTPKVQAREPVGQAEFLIRKPPAEVFESIINPDITTKFWFLKGSGRLEQGKQVRWEFPGKLTAQVAVRAFEPNRRLVMEWWSEGKPPTTVEWLLTPDEGTTRLGVIHSGFVGEPASVESQARDSTAGFTLVLAGLKAFLEHNLQLNLVRDGIECRKHTTVATKAPAETPVGQASLLIRKPIAEVFDAIVDPAITTKFWFLKGSDRLGPGKEVEWVFPGNHTAQVATRAFEPNRRLVLDWWMKGMRPTTTTTTMEWVLIPTGDNATCLSVISSGFTGDPASVADQANFMTGGFTFVLTSMKTFLEHNLKLNQSEYSEKVKR
jgi:uncharacterized protein YndB with AHSA1/START domain